MVDPSLRVVREKECTLDCTRVCSIDTDGLKTARHFHSIYNDTGIVGISAMTDGQHVNDMITVMAEVIRGCKRESNHGRRSRESEERDDFFNFDELGIQSCRRRRHWKTNVDV